MRLCVCVCIYIMYMCVCICLCVCLSVCVSVIYLTLLYIPSKASTAQLNETNLTPVLTTALYVPEYHSYVAGCVHNTANHTFISNKGVLLPGYQLYLLLHFKLCDAPPFLQLVFSLRHISSFTLFSSVICSLLVRHCIDSRRFIHHCVH
jgi:hypothetical protein